MLHKSFPFEFKTLDDAGTFEATVAVFNNVDHGGDRILPGAFAKTLLEWEVSGDPIPVIFNHDWGSVDAHIGVVDAAVETEKGLLVWGVLDVDDNPVAKQVHKLLKRRRLKEFSFGYSVPAGGSKRAKDGANDLSQINLVEVGPTLKGMNPATELHGVKSALGVDEPRAKTEQDEAAKRYAREVEGLAVPEVPDEPNPASAPSASSIPDEIAALKADLEATKQRLEEATRRPAATPAEVDAQAKRVAREVEEIQVPAVKRLASDLREALDSAGAERFGRSEDRWCYLDDYDPDAKWAVFYVSRDGGDRRYVRLTYTADGNDVTLAAEETEVVRTTTYRAASDARAYTTSELQKARADLAEALADVERWKKKAEETDKGRRARSVDPLRQQAEAVALEVATGGIDLPMPTKSAAPAPAPTLSLRDLKRRTRDEMLGVLSGGHAE